MFGKLNVAHNVNTRGSFLYFFTLPCNVSCRQQFIVYQGPCAWNALSDNLKLSKSLCNFKKKLRLHLINSYV